MGGGRTGRENRAKVSLPATVSLYMCALFNITDENFLSLIGGSRRDLGSILKPSQRLDRKRSCPHPHSGALPQPIKEPTSMEMGEQSYIFHAISHIEFIYDDINWMNAVG